MTHKSVSLQYAIYARRRQADSKLIIMNKFTHNLLTSSQLQDIKETFDGMFRVKAGRGLMN